jgi:hypothetical protein
MRTTFLIIVTLIVLSILAVIATMHALNNSIILAPGSSKQEPPVITPLDAHLPTADASASLRTFHGPTSAPHIKGPSGPPPNY